MNERIPSTPPQNGEKLRKPPEQVLSDFRSICEVEGKAPHTKEELITISHRLHENLDELNSAEMIHQYEDGVVPTLDSLTRAAEAAITALNADTDDAEAARLAKLIEGQVRGIRRWCRNYVGTIIRFHRAKSAFFRKEGDEVQDALVSSDHERRRVHNSLLAALTTFNGLLEQAQDIDHFQKPSAWQPGISLPQGTAHTSAVIFSPEAIADRDLIKDWAIAADCVEQIRTVVGTLDGESEKAAT